MVTKTLLMLLTFTAMLTIVLSVDMFRSDLPLYIYTYGIVLGSVLFPVWFFQGFERMRYISILRILSSLIYTGLIFIVVRGPIDYLYVPLLNSLGFIAVGIYSQRIVKREFNVRFLRPSPADIREQLVDGWHLFISTLAISLYTTSNRFILGLLAGNVTVGYYAVAEDITRALLGLTSPISQAIYPYFSRIQEEDRERARSELKKMLIIMGALTFGLSVLMVPLAPFIIGCLLVRDTLRAYPPPDTGLHNIRGGVNNILGTQGLLSFGYKKDFTRMVLYGGLIHIVLFLALVILMGSVGAAIAVVATEIIICIIGYTLLKMRGFSDNPVKR